MKGMICLGMVLKPYGIKGQVRVFPYTASPDSFLKYSEFYLEDGSDITLKNMRITEKSEIIANVDKFNDRNSVEFLRLKKLFIKRETLPPLKENEYYLADLYGLDVLNQDSQKIGIVRAALDYGAGAFIEIDLTDSSKIATIPFNKTSILDVNLDQGLLKIRESFLLK